MKKYSRSLRTAYESVDRTKLYSLEEGVALMKSLSVVKFDPTAEIHFTLGIDPKHADQQIRSTVLLPHGTGKKVRVVVFCEDALVPEAKAAGAVEAGIDHLLEKIQGGWVDFDVSVATPDAMKKIAKIARVLGPRGLMPNPKAGTVTLKIETVVKELLVGRIEFRNDKSGIVHTVFGKLGFSEKQLCENLSTVIKAINENKPSGSKGIYFKNITINATMGPGIKLESPH